MTDIRLTGVTREVVEFLLQDPTVPRHAYDVILGCRRGSGRVYPVLAQLERAGWVVRDWDEPSDGRLPRARYTLTGVGAAGAAALAPAAPRSRLLNRLRPALRPFPAGAVG